MTSKHRGFLIEKRSKIKGPIGKGGLKKGSSPDANCARLSEWT